MSAPFIFASGIIALVMIIGRVPFDITTAIISALTINAAIDFSIYFVADYHGVLLAGHNAHDALRDALKGNGRIIITDMLLNALCFAPLMTSKFIPVQRVGWMMITMLISCGFGALVIMPALLPWCLKKNKSPKSWQANIS